MMLHHDIYAVLSLMFSGAYLLGFCWRRGSSWAGTVVKTASVAVLALGGLDHGIAPLLIAALGFGASGDFWLSRPGERAFVTGLVSFAAAHLAYVIWMWSPGSQIHLWPSLVLMGFGVGMAAVLWPRTGALRGPVMVYIAIIMAMGVAALAAPGAGAAIVLAAGLFIASDAVLSLELFVLRDGHPLRRMTPFFIWATYWLAQIGFFAVGVNAAHKAAL